MRSTFKQLKVGNPQLRDWRRQLDNSITDPEKLADILKLSPGQRAKLAAVSQKYPLRITPYYFSLINPDDPADPIRRQCVPEAAETRGCSRGEEDPFDEILSVKKTGLIHRYAGRAVFLAHNDCAVRCRHCTRKNTWPVSGGRGASSERLAAAVSTVRKKPGINEIIISGGDPLLLETAALARIIDAFRAVSHVRVIRIGTRVPATLPMRIDAELCRMLKKRRPLWVNTHFNHIREITALAADACDRLLVSGLPVSNQTVLLRGVNDEPAGLKSLCEGLFRIMVRPYYLFETDPVRGTAHFRVPRRRGLALHARLRTECSGLALPRYAVDARNEPHKRILA